MQRAFRVYGRGGEPCERCGTLDREDPRRRPRDVVLPDVPAAPGVTDQGVGTRPSRIATAIACVLVPTLELPVDPLDVRADGLGAQEELARDLLLAEAVSEEPSTSCSRAVSFDSTAWLGLRA